LFAVVGYVIDLQRAWVVESTGLTTAAEGSDNGYPQTLYARLSA